MRFSRSLALGSILGFVIMAACVGDEPSTGNGSDGGGGGDAQSGGDGGTAEAACTPNCGSACIDLTGDKDNCGACGHSCLGGQCNGSKCVAAQVFAGSGTDAAVTGVAGLAVDGTSLFWESPLPVRPGLKPQVAATIYQCPNQGPCSVPAIYFQQNDEVDSLGSGGPGFLFLADQTLGVVARVRTDGVDAGAYGTPCPTGNPCAVIQALGASSFALDSTNVYVASNVNGTNGSGLFSGPAFAGSTSGGAAMNQAIPSSPAATAIAVDSTNHYVYASFANGSINAYTTDASNEAAEISVTGQTTVGQITVAHGDVFWTRPDTGDILSIPVCLGINCNNHTVPSVSTFATTSNSYALVSDATNLYWSAGSDVYACPLTGCTGAPTKIASGTARIDAMTIDASAIYWGDDQGSIWKIAK